MSTGTIALLIIFSNVSWTATPNPAPQMGKVRFANEMQRKSSPWAAFSLHFGNGKISRVLFEHLLNNPELQSFRQSVQHQQKRVAIDTVCKSGVSFPQYLLNLLCNLFGRDAPCLHSLYDVFESLRIAGIELCIFAKSVKCVGGSTEHTGIHSAGPKHRDRNPEQLQLHPQRV